MNRRVVMSAVAGLAVFALGGAAFAAWNADGSGIAQVKAVTAQGVTVLASDPAPSLYPGASVALSLKLNNPNSYAVRISGVAADGAITSDQPDCDAGGNGVTFTPVTGLSKSVAAHRTTTLTLPGAVSMDINAPVSCSGATFSIPVRVIAEQVAPTPTTTAPTTPPSSTGPDLQNDPHNCGAVGNDVTVLPHANGTCVNGQAAVESCLSGWGNADGIATNGCEADLNHDPNNCGQVGIVVPQVPHASTICYNGIAMIGACDLGFQDLDGEFADGCEYMIPPSGTPASRVSSR